MHSIFDFFRPRILVKSDSGLVSGSTRTGKGVLIQVVKLLFDYNVIRQIRDNIYFLRPEKVK